MGTKANPNIVKWRVMLKHPFHVISLGFGSGLSPIMPGTVGTLFAWISYDILTYLCPMVFCPLGWFIICVLGFLLGIKTCQATGEALQSPDDGSMVWDEIIAFWLVLIFVTPSHLFIQALAFIIFRIFDMTKPQPIRYFDQHVHGGFGVMLDDLIAAFFTLLVLALMKTAWVYFF